MCGAVGGVKHQRHAVEAPTVHRRDQPLDVAVDACDRASSTRPGVPAGRRCRRGAPPRSAACDVVGELASARSEQLDAVVGERVVRRGDHRRRRTPRLARRNATAGRRHHAEQRHVGALGVNPSPSAASILGPDSRVSRPISQRSRTEHPRRCSSECEHELVRQAVSARPRTPSVPKRRRDPEATTPLGAI